MKQDALQKPGFVHVSKPHESAVKQVSGTADYTDDIAEPVGTMHVYLGLSERAHARIVEMDLSPCLEMDGVIGALTAEDIPGINDISPNHLDDEPVFPTDLTEFFGQPLFAIIAETRDQARKAAHQAHITYEDLPAQIECDG